MAIIPLSSEFPINSTTRYNQDDPAIAMNQSGEYVVTWTTFPDGSDTGVVAQRYDASGNPIGDEFPVNTFTSRKQYNSDVAIDDDGNFVVVWESDGQDGSNFGIFSKRYDSNGNALSGDVRVNTFTAAGQVEPAIAMSPNGDYVVVWQTLNSKYGLTTNVFAQRFNKNGVPQGEEFLVNSITTDNQTSPDVVMDDDGNFIVTWQSTHDSDDVYVRRFNSSGQALGEEVRVNTFTDNVQLQPSIALGEDGTFVVAWVSRRQESSLDAGGIYAQKFSSTGTPVGKEIHVNEEYPVGGQQNPQVAIGADGSFTVTWSGEGNNDVNGVFAKTFDKDGKPTGPETLMNLTTALGQDSQAIAIHPDGQFTVVWNDGLSGDIVGRRFEEGELNFIGDNQDNLLKGNVLNNQIDGQAGNDRLYGDDGNDIIAGGLGSDRLFGENGNDRLTGVSPVSRKPGIGELDQLTGGAGQDSFVLGDRQKIYYDDGSAKILGIKDAALITDFNPRQDSIQLHGERDDYRLGASPRGISKGTAIFLETGKTDEVIAVIEGNQKLSLNSDPFSFV